ncbi:hypothetical protein [Bacillus sp. REN3]|uniref:hypothetical protein n=1 Tax=Bacillus sp. REN3 TaxID=2802440 RepID=UPI001AED4B5C|nr:hypothetical protein [Bacillus sp. REN3]
MEKFILFLLSLFILLSFIVHICGLMHIIPLYVTSPLMFLSLFSLLVYLNSRRSFRGF